MSGPVRDTEFLLRELFNPQHIRDGKVQEAAINVSELMDSGNSLHRMQCNDADFVKASIAKRLTKTRKDGPWTDEGVAKFKAQDVREKRTEDDRQAFEVFATPTTDNPGHASLKVADPSWKKSYVRSLRELLLPLLQNRMSVDKAYE